MALGHSVKRVGRAFSSSVRAWRSRLAGVLAVAAVLGLTIATMPLMDDSLLPAQEAVAGPSQNGDFTVTKTANPTTVPAGGGSVTYTYAVKNNTTGRQYYRSKSDDKCSPLEYQTGMTSTTAGYSTVWFIPAGGTATWTCTQFVTATTTNTATFTFANGYTVNWLTGGLSWSGVESGSAQATVTRVIDGSIPTCDKLWYSSDENTRNQYGTLTPLGTDGTIGTLNTSSGAPTAVFSIGQQTNSTTWVGSAAVAIDPLHPNLVYYIPRLSLASSDPGGPLYVYDTTKGTSSIVTTVNPDSGDLNVRLAADPLGRIWSIGTGGKVWMIDPSAGTPTWQNMGNLTLPNPPGLSPSSLNSGDIAFDGNGTLYFIASNVNSGTTTAHLFTVTQAELLDGAPAAKYVGAMGTTGFNGIAFMPDGTAYTTNSSGLYGLDITTGGTTYVGSTAGAYTTDLTSCALPKPELHVEKTVTPEGVLKPGDTVTYTIIVKNQGTLAATNVTFQDVPTGTTVTGETLNGGANLGATYYNTPKAINSPGELSGIIAPGDTATIRITASVPNPTTLTQVCNQASVTLTGVTATLKSDDPELPGGQDSTCSPVVNPKIAVDKTGSTTVLNADGTPTSVTYTYAVTNTGTEPLKTVGVTDDKCTAPAYQSGDANGDSLLDLTETWTYTCTQTLTAATTNTATATGVGNTTNVTVTATDTWTVSAPPILIDKKSSADGTAVKAGDTITYTIDVTTSGTTDLTGVTLTDALPAGVTYVPNTATKTYPKDTQTGGTQTGTYTTTLGAFGFDTANPANQTFSTVGQIPDGATLTSYSITLKGSSADYRADVSVSGTLPSGANWFNVDRNGDSDTNEFGTNTSGTWNTVTRSGNASGTAVGNFTLGWYDAYNGRSGYDNTSDGVVVTLNYTYDGTTTTRGPVTEPAHAPADLVIAGDNVTLKPTEKMTVTFQVTVNADAPATLVNTATADSAQTEPVTDKVTDNVNRPAIDIAKTPGVIAGPDASGNYTVTYTVTAKNTGTIAGSYGALTDTVAFDPNLTPKSIAWTGPTAALSGSHTYAGAPYTAAFAPADTPIGANETHTYSVTVTFTYTGTGSVTACVDNTPGSGLYNSVAIPQAETDTANNDACVPPTQQFKVQKAVQGSQPGTTGPAMTVGADGKVTVTYAVTVTNTGLIAATPAAIQDQLTAPSGFAITTLTIDGSPVQPATGTFTLPVTELAPSATKTYLVVVTLTAADLQTVDWAKAGTCSTDGAGNASQGGVFNQVTMAGDADGADNSDACVPVQRPTAQIHVQKFGTNCEVGVPTCPAPGVEFAIFDTDPTVSGATALTNGLAADTTGGSTFTSTQLNLGQEYWLVETKAPDGFNLLADPIRFVVTDKGITLLSGASTGTIAVTGSDGLTISITDTAVGELPEAGGAGHLPNLAIGLLVFAGAGIYLLRTSRARLQPRRAA